LLENNTISLEKLITNFCKNL